MLIIQSSLLAKWLREKVMGRARVRVDARDGKCLLFFLKKCKHTPSRLNKLHVSLEVLENMVKARIGSTCYLVSGQQSVHASCHTHCVLLTNWVINRLRKMTSTRLLVERDLFLFKQEIPSAISYNALSVTKMEKSCYCSVSTA